MPSDLEKSCHEHKNPILFDIGIPNLVCGRILGVTECRISLSVSVTLLSGLSFRKNIVKMGCPVLSNKCVAC